MRNFDITALGEILIDFTPCGKSQSGRRLFEQNPGGAPANVLAAVGKLGKKTAFLGKVGQDMHGEFLRQTLIEHEIDADGLVMDDKVFTTLAFVALDENGERSFSFARKPGADICLTQEEVKDEIIQASEIFHIGSLSLTDEPARSAVFHALEVAKKAGAIISYDPNYRAPLWPDEKSASEGMRSVLSYIDVMKLSDEEISLLTDQNSVEDAARKLIEDGIKLVAVTMGEKGAFVCNRQGNCMVPGYHADMVDTTGAGDSFWGGFLYQLLESGKRPEEVTLQEAADFADFGNAVASLCVEKRGGIPAMPTMAEVLRRQKR